MKDITIQIWAKRKRKNEYRMDMGYVINGKQNPKLSQENANKLFALLVKAGIKIYDTYSSGKRKGG